MRDVKAHPDQMGHHRPFTRELRKYRVELPPYLTRILCLAARGLGNKEIALRRGLTEKTVKNHMYELNKAFGTASRTAMVVEAMRQGHVRCPHGCIVRIRPRRKPRPRRR